MTTLRRSSRSSRCTSTSGTGVTTHQVNSTRRENSADSLVAKPIVSRIASSATQRTRMPVVSGMRGAPTSALPLPPRW